MIVEAPTKEKLHYWCEIHKQYKNKLTPNRKSGNEVLSYLLNRYTLDELSDEKYKNVISENVIYNEFLKQKLPRDKSPAPMTFILRNDDKSKVIYENQEDIWNGCPVFIGIDLASGYVHIEGSCLLYDELYAFQGIDEYDLENCVRVAEYIECIKKFNKELYYSLCGKSDT